MNDDVANEAPTESEAGPVTQGSPCPNSEGCVPGWGIIAVSVATAAITALVLYGLWGFWPRSELAAADTEVRVTVFFSFLVALEVQLLVLVALAGALGSLLHVLRSLSWYIGNRALKWSWVPYYFLLPLVGAVLGSVLYLLFRGGLFSGEASALTVNKFGMPAVAALAGLFSQQALEKLKTIAGAVFELAEQGEDAVIQTNDEA